MILCSLFGEIPISLQTPLTQKSNEFKFKHKIVGNKTVSKFPIPGKPWKDEWFWRRHFQLQLPWLLDPEPVRMSENVIFTNMN